MKKLFAFLMLILTAVGSVSAQNANRSGFFLEAGVGVPIGTTPTYKLKVENDVLVGYRAGGIGYEAALGYRYALSVPCAIEIMAQFSALSSNLDSTGAISVMPGFRYTTTEILGNMSLYFGVNAGLALGKDYISYRSYNYSSQVISDDFYGDWAGSLGGTGQISFGLNITSSLSIGVAYQQYFMNDKLSGVEDKMLSWGTATLSLGYRF